MNQAPTTEDVLDANIEVLSNVLFSGSASVATCTANQTANGNFSCTGFTADIGYECASASAQPVASLTNSSATYTCQSDGTMNVVFTAGNYPATSNQVSSADVLYVNALTTQPAGILNSSKIGFEIGTVEPAASKKCVVTDVNTVTCYGYTMASGYICPASANAPVLCGANMLPKSDATTCIAAAGYYGANSISNSATVTPCPGNTTSVEGTTDVSGCTVNNGYYVSVGASGGNAATTAQCPAGFACPTGANASTTTVQVPLSCNTQTAFICPAGTYYQSPQNSSTVAAGDVNTIFGEVLCNATTRQADGTAQNCVAKAGYYGASVVDTSAATPCPANTNSVSGATALSGCTVNDGYYVSAGSTGGNPATIIQCAAGSVCPTGANANTTTPQVPVSCNTQTAFICPAGTYYASLLGAAVAAGDAGNITGEVPCHATRQADNTAQNCIAQAGYHGASVVDSSAATVCPTGTTSAIGATALSGCSNVAAGYYLPAATGTGAACTKSVAGTSGTNGTCSIPKACPVGSYCPAGTGNPLMLNGAAITDVSGSNQIQSLSTGTIGTILVSTNAVGAPTNVPCPTGFTNALTGAAQGANAKDASSCKDIAAGYTISGTGIAAGTSVTASILNAAATASPPTAPFVIGANGTNICPAGSFCTGQAGAIAFSGSGGTYSWAAVTSSNSSNACPSGFTSLVSSTLVSACTVMCDISTPPGCAGADYLFNGAGTQTIGCYYGNSASGLNASNNNAWVPATSGTASPGASVCTDCTNGLFSPGWTGPISNSTCFNSTLTVASALCVSASNNSVTVSFSGGEAQMYEAPTTEDILDANVEVLSNVVFAGSASFGTCTAYQTANGNFSCTGFTADIGYECATANAGPVASLTTSTAAYACQSGGTMNVVFTGANYPSINNQVSSPDIAFVNAITSQPAGVDASSKTGFQTGAVNSSLTKTCVVTAANTVTCYGYTMTSGYICPASATVPVQCGSGMQPTTSPVTCQSAAGYFFANATSVLSSAGTTCANNTANLICPNAGTYGSAATAAGLAGAVVCGTGMQPNAAATACQSAPGFFFASATSILSTDNGTTCAGNTANFICPAGTVGTAATLAGLANEVVCATGTQANAAATACAPLPPPSPPPPLPAPSSPPPLPPPPAPPPPSPPPSPTPSTPPSPPPSPPPLAVPAGQKVYVSAAVRLAGLTSATFTSAYATVFVNATATSLNVSSSAVTITSVQDSSTRRRLHAAGVTVGFSVATASAASSSTLAASVNTFSTGAGAATFLTTLSTACLAASLAAPTGVALTTPPTTAASATAPAAAPGFSTTQTTATSGSIQVAASLLLVVTLALASLF